MKRFVAIVMVGILAAPAGAKSLAEARAETPTATIQTAHSIYDVERCIIGIDMLFLPVVYSQPDHPHEREIVYGGAGQGVRYLFKLAARNDGTTVVAWAQSGELKPAILKCF